MNYTEYDPVTGQILNLLTMNAETVPADVAQRPWIPGHHNERTHYVANKQIVAKPHDEHAHLPGRYWNYQTCSWQTDLTVSENTIRTWRNELLKTVDRVNPVWFNALTPAQQQQLIQYRQALLDVPQQTNFPESVEWPAKPSWL